MLLERAYCVWSILSLYTACTAILWGWKHKDRLKPFNVPWFARASSDASGETGPSKYLLLVDEIGSKYFAINPLVQIQFVLSIHYCKQ